MQFDNVKEKEKNYTKRLQLFINCTLLKTGRKGELVVSHMITCAWEGMSSQGLVNSHPDWEGRTCQEGEFGFGGVSIIQE
jgi:hypothetical protein